MKKQKLLFNHLLRLYVRCIRRRKNLVLTNRNQRRQLILSKHIERLHEKLLSLKTFIQKRTVATGMVVGTFAFTGSEANAQAFGPVQTNPFSLTSIGGASSPTVADLDGDGDLDVLSGNSNGSFYYFQNIGTSTSPVFGTVQTNPFSLTDIGNNSNPCFADLDGDGDFDILSGEANGEFYYFQNTGTSTAPVFGPAQFNPFNLSDIYYSSSVAFGDLDDDGDLDVLAGNIYSSNWYFRNTGTASSPFFGTKLLNPYALTGFVTNARHDLADLDQDGDLDLLVGETSGNLYYLQNTGTSTAPVFGTPQLNPFGLTDIGNASTPRLADFDGDGDLDVLVGSSTGNFYYFENISCFNTASTHLVSACGSYTWMDGNTYTSSTNTPTHILPNAAGCDSLITLNLTIHTIVDQTVNASSGTICNSGSTSISLGSTQTGVNYYLRNDATNAIVDGPVSGTGSSIAFNTGTITSSTTYNVYAEKNMDYGLEFSAPLLQRAEITAPFTAYSNKMTVEAWVYFANPTNSFPWMGQSQPGFDHVSTNVWIWHGLGSGNEFTWYVNDNGTWRFVNSSGLTGVTGWHHIATVADASSIRIYIDGVLNATGPGISAGIRNSATSAIHIGNDPRFPLNSGYHGNFVVSDFRLWNTARTGAEITSNMNSCLIGNEAGLKHYNKFNTNSGTVAFATTGANANLSASMVPSTDWVTGNGICETECTFEMTQLATVNVNSSTTSTDVHTQCDSYTWIDGNTYSSSTNTPTHTITNAAGCDSIITLNLTILNSTSSTDAQTACGSYTWIDGNTYSSSTNTPIYTLTNTAGCDSVVTLNLTINNLPDMTANVAGVTITANETGATYQWIDCDNSNLPIGGATNQSYTASVNGNYAVIVNDGTCSDTSACYNVTGVGLSNIPNPNFTVVVYPNPASNQVAISSNFTIENMVIKNLAGQVVWYIPLHSTKATVDVSVLGNGVYTVETLNEEGELIGINRLVIAK